MSFTPSEGSRNVICAVKLKTHGRACDLLLVPSDVLLSPAVGGSCEAVSFSSTGAPLASYFDLQRSFSSRPLPRKCIFDLRAIMSAFTAVTRVSVL